MSGHSKWATTKRQKAIVDAKKGAIFTKYANLITIAARQGCVPSSNFSLRLAMDKARAVNIPMENIERAVKRGTGELGGAQIEELTYEGVGPAKSQFIIKCLTNNKNRTASVIRHQFSGAGGSLGSVLWNFKLKGVILITTDELKSKNLFNNDSFELELIDAGAQDFIKEAAGATIYTKPKDLQKVKQFLETKNIKTASAEIEYAAKEQLNLNAKEKEQVEKFIEELEDNEDVSDYYTNANL
jgi:YebC/PmpR family DNA-binding regulatory protein